MDLPRRLKPPSTDSMAAQDQFNVARYATVAHVVLTPLFAVTWLLVEGLTVRFATSSIFIVVVAVAVLATSKPANRILAFFFIDIVGICGTLIIDPSQATTMILAVGAVSAFSWSLGPKRAVLVSAFAGVAVGASMIIAGVPGAFTIAAFGGPLIVAVAIHNGRVFRERLEATESMARVLDNLPVMIWEFNLETSDLRVTGRTRDLLGLEPHEVTNERHWLHPDDRKRLAEAVSAATEEPSEVRTRVISPEGWRSTKTVIRKTGSIVHGVSADVSEEDKAQEAATHWSGIVERMTDAVLVLEVYSDGSTSPVRWNEPMARLLDSHRGNDSILDETMRAAASQTATDGDSRAGKDLLRPVGNAMRAFDWEIYRLDPRTVAVQFSDVTERRDAAESAQHQATHDELTGLANRRQLYDRLDQSIAMAERTPGHRVALLLLDLDGFKKVNDSLGHHTGDRVLRIIAQRMDGLRGPVTVACRLGGDEFAFLVEGDLTDDDIHRFGERIVDVAERPISLDGTTIKVGASVGIALAPDDAEDHVSLLQRADVAMYAAKRSQKPVARYAAEVDRVSSTS